MIPGLSLLLSSKLGRNIALYGALAAALLWAWRLHTNQIAERAAAEAKLKQVEAQLSIERQQWETRELALKARYEELNKGFSELDDLRVAVGKNRISIQGDLAQGLSAIKGDLDRRYNEIAQVPVSDLDAVIKHRLAELRTP